jgi:hypothetical protein
MVVRLSASCAGRRFPPGRFLVLISVRGWVDPRIIMRLEELVQLKNPMTSSGIEPATFRLVVPQPTTLPRTPLCKGSWSYLNFRQKGEIVSQFSKSPRYEDLRGSRPYHWQEMEVSVQLHSPADLSPRGKSPQEARWAPEPAWTLCIKDKSSVPAGNQTWIPRSSNLHPSNYTQ